MQFFIAIPGVTNSLDLAAMGGSALSCFVGGMMNGCNGCSY